MWELILFFIKLYTLSTYEDVLVVPILCFAIHNRMNKVINGVLYKLFRLTHIKIDQHFCNLNIYAYETVLL